MECRTCLASGVQLIKLDAKLQDLRDVFRLKDIGNTKITLLDCLLFCTRLQKLEDCSNSICVECSRALEVSFIFIKNALTANAILLQRTAAAGQNKCADAAQTKVPTRTKNEQTGGVKFRCKICQEKLNSKSALKDHVKLHMDVITYRCQMCDFDCKKRTHLSEHYSNEHNIEASSSQLKPFMQPNTAVSKEDGPIEIQQEFLFESEEPPTKLQRLMNLEARKKEEEEAQKLLDELEQSFSQKQHQQIVTTAANAAGELEVIDELGNISVAFDQLAATMVPEGNVDFGNEFVMLSDGSVQKVDGSGIMIEYVEEEIANDGITFLDGNDLIVDNTIQIDTSCNADLVNTALEEIVEDAVIENSSNAMDATNFFATTRAKNRELPTSSDKQNYCKICNQVFGTRSELKIHMLGHSEIPHFFCDRCSFYTFFKNDLTQHYKSKHHVHPSSKQLQPRNKKDSTLGMPLYSCDLCFFETTIRLDLQHHYLRAHKVVANDVQLRPTIDKTDIEIKQAMPNKRQNFRQSSKQTQSTTIACKLCKSKMTTQREYREHLLWHKQEKKKEAMKRLLETNAEDMEKIKQREKQLIGNQTLTEVLTIASGMESDACTGRTTEAAIEVSMPVASLTNNFFESHVVYQQEQPLQVEQQQQQQLAQQYALPIENNVILPMEAIPQVIASEVIANEQTITADGQINFDFNGDDIFDDFDNVHDSNDVHDDELGNLVLTSEDDFDDLIEDNGVNEKNLLNSNMSVASNTTAAITRSSQLSANCAQCNKRFFSQYQFENHMFIHRGLAPYRCELCTNLYNTKRALIKHYKVVHKRMPTRDMIQAKGDKVDTQNDAALLELDNTKAGTLMCAKCPFESTELLNLQLHLSNTHGITDQNFVVAKLPFECPRCIRSFETKAHLMRHLERNHSTRPILEQTLKPNHYNAVETIEAVPSPQEKLQEQQQQQQSTLTEAASSTTSGTVGNQLSQPQQQPQVATQQQRQQFLWQHQQQQHVFNDINIVDEQSSLNITTTSSTTTTQPSTTVIAETSLSTRGEDSLVCKICQQIYKSTTLLKFHMKRHVARTFCCKFCPKSFVTRSDLERHLALHNGELRYKCDICDKKFGYAHHLKRHRDTLHFGRRYICSTLDCGKVFASRTQLTLHRRNHDGTKPFKCPHCLRVFNRREYFRQHALKAHNLNLSQAEIAEVYRATTGHCNPHDLLVANEGQFVRRSDIEALAAKAAVANIPTIEESQSFEDIQIEEIKLEEAKVHS